MKIGGGKAKQTTVGHDHQTGWSQWNPMGHKSSEEGAFGNEARAYDSWGCSARTPFGSRLRFSGRKWKGRGLFWPPFLYTL